MTGHDNSRITHRAKPWFGPKRVGWGIRPQTWQGWLVVALIVVALVLTRLFIR